MMCTFKRSSIFCLSLALAACAGMGKNESAPLTEEQQTQEILRRIETGVMSATEAQAELARVAEARAARDAFRRKQLTSESISLDFYGDAEDVVRDIAGRFSYEFKVYGKRPPERANVNIYVKDKPAIEVLKMLGNQTAFFDIKLTKTAIELHYKILGR